MPPRHLASNLNTTITLAELLDCSEHPDYLSYFHTTYTVLGFKNLTHAFFWQLVGTIVVCMFLRPLLLFINRILTPSRDYRPPAFIAQRLDGLIRAVTAIFDGVHYFWTLLVLIITIPYSRMQDALKVRF